jgi:hypothetical protein
MIEDARQPSFASASATAPRQKTPLPPPSRGRTAERERQLREPASAGGGEGAPLSASRRSRVKRAVIRERLETISLAELSRQTREASRRRAGPPRRARARRTARPPLAPRSTAEVRRVGKLTVTTRARGRRREPKRSPS